MQFNFFLKPRSAPDAVDRFVSSCLNDPGAWELGDAGVAPLVYGDRKSFLSRLFRDIEVAEVPNQRGDYSAPIGAIYCVNSRVGFEEHAL